MLCQAPILGPAGRTPEAFLRTLSWVRGLLPRSDSHLRGGSQGGHGGQRAGWGACGSSSEQLLGRWIWAFPEGGPLPGLTHPFSCPLVTG